MSAEAGTCGACRWFNPLGDIDTHRGECHGLPTPSSTRDSYRCSLYSSRPDAKPPRPSADPMSIRNLVERCCALCAQNSDTPPERKGYRWFVHLTESGAEVPCEASNIWEALQDGGDDDAA